MFLEISQNPQENTCARVSFLYSCRPEAGNFIKKETLAQVLFCEFCEISKNTFFTEVLWTTAYEQTSVRSKRPWVDISTVYSFCHDFFPWLHIERFQNTKVRQFCLRLRVVRRGVEIMYYHLCCRCYFL